MNNPYRFRSPKRRDLERQLYEANMELARKDSEIKKWQDAHSAEVDESSRLQRRLTRAENLLSGIKCAAGTFFLFATSTVGFVAYMSSLESDNDTSTRQGNGGAYSIRAEPPRRTNSCPQTVNVPIALPPEPTFYWKYTGEEKRSGQNLLFLDAVPSACFSSH